MNGEIIQGDALDTLRMMETGTANCCVTSPPYYGLRDYGVAGQIGLEPTPQAYIARMVEVFREVRRVLTADGTLWLNIGDSYASTGGHTSNGASSQRQGRSNIEAQLAVPSRTPAGFKTKDLMMIPARLAIALQEDGWYLRSDIIWAKPNPMPESVTDRPTSAHEHIFLLTKSARYYFDADAIKEPITASSMARLGQNADGQHGSDRANGGGKTNGAMKAVCFGGTKGNADGASNRGRSGNEWNPGKGNRKTFRGGGAYTGGDSFDNDTAKPNDSVGNKPNESMLRNSRNVWAIATRGYKEAHFATFPPEIPRRCISAGCPPGGLVLDPFGGSGTVGAVAEELDRCWVLIELNPDYCELARKRTAESHATAERIRNAPRTLSMFGDTP